MVVCFQGNKNGTHTARPLVASAIVIVVSILFCVFACVFEHGYVPPGFVCVCPYYVCVCVPVNPRGSGKVTGDIRGFPPHPSDSPQINQHWLEESAALTNPQHTHACTHTVGLEDLGEEIGRASCRERV